MRFTMTSFQASNQLTSALMKKIAEYNESLISLTILSPVESAAHNKECQKAFLSSLKECNEYNRALILGSGNCSDIPVSELLEMFEKVSFLDIDKVATPLALSKVESNNSSVHLVVEDMTGVLQPILAALDEFSQSDNFTDIHKRFL